MFLMEEGAEMSMLARARFFFGEVILGAHHRPAHEPKVNYVPYGEGRGDVDAGEDMPLLGEVLQLLISWQLNNKSARSERDRGDRRSARLPPEPCFFIHVQSTGRFRYCCTTSRDLILLLIVRICLSPHIDTIYGDVSVCIISSSRSFVTHI